MVTTAAGELVVLVGTDVDVTVVEVTVVEYAVVEYPVLHTRLVAEAGGASMPAALSK